MNFVSKKAGKLARERINLLENKLVVKSKLIRENKSTIQISKKDIDSLISEAARIERLYLMEDLSKKDFDTQMEEMSTVAMAMHPLIGMKNGLSEKIVKVRQDFINYLRMYRKDPDAIRLDRNLKKDAVKTVIDLLGLFRACWSIAQTLENSTDFKSSVDSLVKDHQNAGSDVEGLSLNQIASWQSEETSEDDLPMKKGFSIFKKKASKTSSQIMVEKIRKILDGAVKSKSPSADMLVGGIVDQLMNIPLGQLVETFSGFYHAASQTVDPEELTHLAMSPKGLGSTLKGVWDSLGGGGFRLF